MEYNSLILHFLNQFKSKINSLDSPENFQETYKTMLQELNNLETIIQIHAHKTGVFSVFLPEIRDLTLKLSSLKRLYPTPKKKLSFFSMQLAKIHSNIDKVKAKPLEADFFKAKNDEIIVIGQNQDFKEANISKKKQKIESLVQDRLANSGMSSGNKFFKPPLVENNKEFNNNGFFNKNIQTKDPLNNKEPSYPKDQSFKDQYNNPNNNNNKKDPYNKDPYGNRDRNKDIYLNNSEISNPPMFQQQSRGNRNQTKQLNREPPTSTDTSSGFITAKDQLRMNTNLPNKQYNNNTNNYSNPEESDDNKTPATTLNKRFQPPYKAPTNNKQFSSKLQSTITNSSRSKIPEDKLKNLDQKMVELIESEILDNTPKLSWSDISGLEAPKAKIIEMIVWPFSNPEIFTGIRAPPRGLLLFGPPGTGKTMIGKAIASDTNFTFFSISASSLTSKWVGEGEKMVKTLFMLALAYQPAVVFIDEVDSLLCSRSENENEASRRIKTEFLCQMEGTNTNNNERLLLIGATNRPQELDDAALRRFVKKLYIPLPNKSGRREFLKSIIRKEMEHGNKYELTEEEIEEIVEKTKGYSGADLRNLCAESALNPLRGAMDISKLTKESLRATNLKDFIEALAQVKPSVSQKDLKQYLDWNRNYGTVQFNELELDN